VQKLEAAGTQSRKGIEVSWQHSYSEPNRGTAEMQRSCAM